MPSSPPACSLNPKELQAPQQETADVHQILKKMMMTHCRRWLSGSEIRARDPCMLHSLYIQDDSRRVVAELELGSKPS